MGGPESGMRVLKSAKTTVEECLDLDIAELKRVGALTAGAKSTCTWQNTKGKELASIAIYADTNEIGLRYAVCIEGRAAESVDCNIAIAYTACNFGGKRPWFVCPGCLRRVGRLYLHRDRFRCRRCHDLAYTSQQKSEMDRLLDKIQAIRAKLGGSCDIYDPFPAKPEEMGEKTYKRLRMQAIRAEARLNCAMWRYLDKP